ncbi:MAG TPA: permease, partial [Elusimicrobiota bacterium]|nr:permease [Elusimicrobiota bacterium]
AAAARAGCSSSGVAAATGEILIQLTIVPLFAGIYKKGAGIGPAITFLFFAPAANILALVYTGAALGGGFATARLVLSLVFSIGIGMIMALIFRKDDAARAAAPDDAFAGKGGIKKSAVLFLLLMVAGLLVGTLKLSFLTDVIAQFHVPWAGAHSFQESLHRLIPFDPAKGEEGLTLQGLALIGLLGLIGVTAWRGLGKIDRGFSRWTWAALGLIGLTLAFAALDLRPDESGLTVGITGRMLGVLATMAGLAMIAREKLETEEIQRWLSESWGFARQIFPLLIIGVFGVGVIRLFIRPEWVESVAGRNTIGGNLAGVVFGVFMYFPTLVEVPIAKMFLSLGMHRGPLIAYLMADPELSLQSILIVSTVIGRVKAWTYVAWVALFSMASGLLYGAWVDGASACRLGAGLIFFIGTLLGSLAWASRRATRRVSENERGG